jgi:hypothetical protein
MAINDLERKRKGENLGRMKETLGDIQSTSQVDDDKPFCFTLVFTWSYTLSSRWVELIQYAGANVQLLQDEEINAQKFWDLI